MRQKLSISLTIGTFIALMAVTGGILLLFGGNTVDSSKRLHSVDVEIQADMASPDDLASLDDDLEAETENEIASETNQQEEYAETSEGSETETNKANTVQQEDSEEFEDVELEEKVVLGDPDFEETEFGAIPAVVDNPTDTKVLEAYSLTPPKVKRNTQALYSLLILDFGLSEKINSAIYGNLPEFSTLIASPYVANLPQKVAEARNNNFEVWLNVPLENTNGVISDNGPYTLRSKATLEQNTNRLHNIMSSSLAIPGLYTSARNKTNASSDLRFLLTEGKERGYGLFLQGKSGAPEFYLSRNENLEIRQEDFNSFIDQTLQQSKGIMVVEANPKAFKVIKELTERMSRQGLQLVPLTRLVRSDI